MSVLLDKAAWSAHRAQVLRTNLAEAAENGPIESILTTVHALAAAEEQRHWYSLAAKIPVEDLPKWLIRYSTTGTDDIWSGRGNDLRRVQNDAKLEALRTIGEFLDGGLL
jgi:hypothetical protein